MEQKINYIELFSYFVNKEGLSRPQSLRNIWRTRNLPKEFKKVIKSIIEEKFHEAEGFQVDGISLSYLVKEQNMKMVQAVFFLDWLRREPGNARAFIGLEKNAHFLEFDDELRRTLEQKLLNIQLRNDVRIESFLVPEDNTGQDIDVNSSSGECTSVDSIQE